MAVAENEKKRSIIHILIMLIQKPFEGREVVWCGNTEDGIGR